MADTIDKIPATQDADYEMADAVFDISSHGSFPTGEIADMFARHRQYGYDQGYYDGCANPIVRHDALREALADLLHAVCGEKGFAQAVRRDSGRIYPWPALDLAEAKAISALEQSK